MRNIETINQARLNNIKTTPKTEKPQNSIEKTECFKNLFKELKELKEEETLSLEGLGQLLSFQGIEIVNINVEELKQNLDNFQILESIKATTSGNLVEAQSKIAEAIDFKTIDLKELINANKEVTTFFQKIQASNIEAEGEVDKTNLSSKPPSGKIVENNTPVLQNKIFVAEEKQLVNQDIKIFENPLKTQSKEKQVDLEGEVINIKPAVETYKETQKLTFKVGDGEGLNSKAFAEEVNKQILIDFKEGTRDYEIQLEPYNLGKIKIKVTQEGMKTLVSIICSEQKTASLLNINGKEINNIINNHNRGEIYVDIKDESYLNQERDSDQGSRKNQQQYQQNKEQKDAQEFANKMRVKLIEPELV